MILPLNILPILRQAWRNFFSITETVGYYSFNVSLFFGPSDQKYFSCHCRIAPHTFLNMRDFASDLNFYQALFDESVRVFVREELCSPISGKSEAKHFKSVSVVMAKEKSLHVLQSCRCTSRLPYSSTPLRKANDMTVHTMTARTNTSFANAA